MSKVSGAVREIESIDALAREHTLINDIHPAIKLAVTVVYLVMVVSFSRYQLVGLLGMAIYPFALFEITGLSFKDALHRLRIVLPLVCIVGIFNPFFDRAIVTTIFGMPISGGVLSMITLLIKGVLTVLASYLLIATTTVDKICYAMRCFHIPKIIVTEFMLICRYISVLGREADRLMQSYHMRAPGQKGIHYKAWGPVIGQLLLRSMDRAEIVYQSMQLRGFKEDFVAIGTKKLGKNDWMYLAGFTFAIIVFRFIPIFELIGGIFA